MDPESQERKRQAFLAMRMPVEQQSPPQVRPPEQAPPRIDLSQVRPVVQRTVSQQERNAGHVFTYAMGVFMEAPGLARKMHESDSELARLYSMARG